MDLREKASLLQRVSEYSIRFRLIEIVVAFALCIIALINIEGVLVSIVFLSEQAENVAMGIAQYHFLQNRMVIYAVLLLFVFRWGFFGFKCALFWFFFLLFNGLFLIGVGEYKDIMQIFLACVFIIAVTAFFFIRSLIIKSILPMLLLVYSFSAWLLFLGVSNLVWFGLVSIFCADTVHLILGLKTKICEEKTQNKPLEGAIAHGVHKIIPVSLLTIALLIAMDIVFFFMGLPLLAAEDLQCSIIIYLCYVLWMPFFTAALLSFCPLENTCETILKKSK